MTDKEILKKRLDFACEQLDVAIELFFSRRSYISVLTLAGAAEEILGTEAKNRGRPNAISKKYELSQRIFYVLEKNRHLYPKVRFELLSWKAHIAKANYARNAAKHIADASEGAELYDEYFRADPFAAAVSMVMRAVQNQDLLGLPRSDLAQKFYGWHLSSIYSSE